jgi:hypothetical protein
MGVAMSSHQSAGNPAFRLLQRGGEPSLTLPRARAEDFEVEAEDESARTLFHPPTNPLSLERGGTVWTVKNAAYESWYTAHVSRCGDCDLHYNPFDGLQYPYCGHDNYPTTEVTK